MLIIGYYTFMFLVEKNSIQVTPPRRARGKVRVRHQELRVLQYGGTLHGWVEYPKSNRKGCQSFDQFDISFKPKKAGGRPNFVLVDRGGDEDSLVFVPSPMFASIKFCRGAPDTFFCFWTLFLAVQLFFGILQYLVGWSNQWTGLCRVAVAFYRDFTHSSATWH